MMEVNNFMQHLKTCQKNSKVVQREKWKRKDLEMTDMKLQDKEQNPVEPCGTLWNPMFNKSEQK